MNTYHQLLTTCPTKLSTNFHVQKQALIKIIEVHHLLLKEKDIDILKDQIKVGIEGEFKIEIISNPHIRTYY